MGWARLKLVSANEVSLEVQGQMQQTRRPAGVFPLTFTALELTFIKRELTFTKWELTFTKWELTFIK